MPTNSQGAGGALNPGTETQAATVQQMAGGQVHSVQSYGVPSRWIPASLQIATT